MSATNPALPAEDVLSRLVAFFCDFFKRPDPLGAVRCLPSYREYVPSYYRKTFVKAEGVTRRHRALLRRLAPVLALPPGSRVVDYGGGYGLDSLLLAALGFDVVFYEITPNHVAIADFLKAELERELGPLPMRCVLASPDEDLGTHDAVFCDEVAHHIEPPRLLFDKVATIAPRLFLLEPSFWNPAVQAYFFRVRGFKTVIRNPDGSLYGWENIRPPYVWDAHAREAGFERAATHWVFSWKPEWRAIERVPGLRAAVCPHVTLEYVRTA